MDPDNYVREATVRRVVDGDTIDLTIDLGFGVGVWERVRLIGIDTPETRTRDLDEKSRGLRAKAFVELWVQAVFGEVMLESVEFRTGKFGRVLGRIWDPSGDECLNDVLLEQGLAVPYE